MVLVFLNLRREFLHNVFRDEALPYYHAYTEGCSKTYSETIVKISNQFNSITKQQSLKAELSAVSFQSLINEYGDDR